MPIVDVAGTLFIEIRKVTGLDPAIRRFLYCLIVVGDESHRTVTSEIDSQGNVEWNQAFTLELQTARGLDILVHLYEEEIGSATGAVTINEVSGGSEVTLPLWHVVGAGITRQRGTFSLGGSEGPAGQLHMETGWRWA